VAEGIVVAVIGGLILLGIGAAWKGRFKPLQWYRDQRAADRAMTREDAAEELRRLRKQVLQVARAHGIVIPVGSQRINPTVVSFSDGSKRYYFRDQDQYVRAMQARKVPLRLTYRGTPPRPLSQWTRAVLMQWLADNA